MWRRRKYFLLDVTDVDFAFFAGYLHHPKEQPKARVSQECNKQTTQLFATVAILYVHNERPMFTLSYPVILDAKIISQSQRLYVSEIPWYP